MMQDNEILNAVGVKPLYRDHLAEILRPFWLHTYVDILVVVDTAIATQPGIGFGIGTVIEHIRSSSVGCMRFRVDIAQRSGGTPAVAPSPGPYDPKYTAFRFDMQAGGSYVIDKYEQIWCFGFDPDNNGDPDHVIDAHPTAATNSELAKLASWMKVKKGGLFATGDHDYLGASMCRKIPRIGTMRKWTNADGVPPIGSPDRIDTLRPPGPAYYPGAPGGPLDLANIPHQGDAMHQPIEWVPWKRVRLSVFRERVRPHPVLCHYLLGPIDVMPDHAHEGLCRDTGTVPLNGTYDFDGSGPQPEYPDALNGGPKPEPMVIAYGSTLPDPPYNFDKGPQPYRPRFPMISVYDGHRAGVGRVATDSTWHHWMDVNIADLKAANGTVWKKISRYFLNLATWLNPPGFSTRCLHLEVLASHFQYPGFQEYSPRLSTLELGQAARTWLVGIYGSCWVTQSVFDVLDDLDFAMFERPFEPEPWPCLTCPPWDLIEEAVLGGLVRASLPEADQIKRAIAAGERPRPVRVKSLADMMLPGVKPALAEAVQMLRENMGRIDKDLAQLERFAGPARKPAAKAGDKPAAVEPAE